MSFGGDFECGHTTHLKTYFVVLNVLLFTRVFEYSRSSTRRGLSLFGILLGERDLSREKTSEEIGKGASPPSKPPPPL